VIRRCTARLLALLRGLHNRGGYVVPLELAANRGARPHLTVAICTDIDAIQEMAGLPSPC